MNWIPTTINLALLSAGVALAIPSIILLAECAASWLPRRRPTAKPSAARPSIAVLIPAHNESLTISATLAAATLQLAPNDRILVVADNCTDDTAHLARLAGTDVLERFDTVNRGKGFALAAGIEHLRRLGPPDVLLLLDADVAPPPAAIQTLANAAHLSGQPVQAIYLLHADQKPTPKSVVSELAFITKNLVRPLGLHNLGQPVLLTGTGIALPWPVLASVDLASGDLVEDMKLGLDLLRAGHPPALCPDVVIRGSLPDSTRTAFTQRTRWEHGHLSVIKRFVPALLADALRLRPGALAIALDLLVPPLALLVGLLVGLAAISLGWAWMSSRWVSFAVAVGSLFVVGCAVALAWLRGGRHLPLWNLLAVPFYVLWKIPMYLRFFAGRKQSTWVRTDRV